MGPYGRLNLMFHCLLDFALGPSPRDGWDTHIDRPCQFLPNEKIIKTKKKSHFLWYGLWKRVDGPPNYMIMVFGSSVKWPLCQGEDKQKNDSYLIPMLKIQRM